MSLTYLDLAEVKCYQLIKSVRTKLPLNVQPAAGFFASLVASYVAKIQGRKFCLILSGSCYLIGVILTTAVPARQNALAMLIVGRAMLGCGVGFANASVTVYASEVDLPLSINWSQKFLPLF